MVTTLGIVLAVLIVLNIWLGVYTAKREKERRKQLQERLDECDESIGEVMNKLGLAKQHLNEAQSLCTALKKENKKILAEYSDLKLSYDRVKKENEELKKKIALMNVDPHAEPQEPVDGGPVNNDVKPTEPKLKKVNLATLDLQDLRKSYDELAKRYENPSKTYLVRNLVKVYAVQSRTQLAKALGVSQQSINQMLRKK